LISDLVLIGGRDAMRNFGLALVVGLGSLALSASAFATEQVYHPVNPIFGGNPLNGTFLLSQAQAQGLGTKSGASQQPDLSGLTSALSNIGSSSNPAVIIANPTGSGN
jgi:curli production assembly/transport component CsgF